MSKGDHQNKVFPI